MRRCELVGSTATNGSTSPSLKLTLPLATCCWTRALHAVVVASGSSGTRVSLRTVVLARAGPPAITHASETAAAATPTARAARRVHNRLRVLPISGPFYTLRYVRVYLRVKPGSSKGISMGPRERGTSASERVGAGRRPWHARSRPGGARRGGSHRGRRAVLDGRCGARGRRSRARAHARSD